MTLRTLVFRKILSAFGLSKAQIDSIQRLHLCIRNGTLSRDPVKAMNKARASIRKENRKFRYAQNIHIGDFTSLKRSSVYMNDYDTPLIVGKFCSVSWETSFLLKMEHRKDWVSTFSFPNYLRLYRDVDCAAGKGRIVVGNDVWIGSGVKVLSGVKIGDGAVVGANSLVTKDIPAYSVWAGVPAKEIKKRFSDGDVEKLKSMKWWDWPDEAIYRAVPMLLSDNIEDLYQYYRRQFAPPTSISN
jgi:acetyltransferase-like isoleucine patch superfamily enzyme